MINMINIKIEGVHETPLWSLTQKFTLICMYDVIWSIYNIYLRDTIVKGVQYTRVRGVGAYYRSKSICNNATNAITHTYTRANI